MQNSESTSTYFTFEQVVEIAQHVGLTPVTNEFKNGYYNYPDYTQDRDDNRIYLFTKKDKPHQFFHIQSAARGNIFLRDIFDINNNATLTEKRVTQIANK